MHVAFVGRQAGGFQHRGERRFAVLRAAPDLAFVRGVERGGVHRLHGGVVLVGIVVDRLDLLGGAGERGLDVAVLVADKAGCALSRPSLEPFGDRCAGDLGVLAFVPDDRQRIERGLGVPPGVGDDGDRGVADPHHLLDALHAVDLGFVEALQLAAEHRAILDRGVEHARQLDVDAVDHLAGGLVGGVEPLQRLAGDLPVLRVLQLDVGRRRRAWRRPPPPCRRSWSCPSGVCVMTLLAAVHSDAGTFHSLAAAWISIMRAAAPPLRT